MDLTEIEIEAINRLYTPDERFTSEAEPMAILVDCTCGECTQQFRSEKFQCCKPFRYRRILSKRQAEAAVGTLVSNINRDLSYLQNECKMHGDAIINRWNKKKRDQREKILLGADSNMYPLQWLPARYSFGTKEPWKVRDIHPKTCLVPYINIQNLRDNPSKFISLLLNRTNFTPEQWAPFDSTQLNWAWYHPACYVDFYSGSIIMHGDRYGQVTERDRQSAERWEHIGFPRGKLVLEAQEYIMGFLSNVVQQLLGSSRIGLKISSEKWDKIGGTSVNLHGCAEYRPKLLNQPFLPPPTLDINKLLSVAQAELDDASDHLWLLQTAPAYMRRAMGASAQGYEVSRKTFARTVGNDTLFVSSFGSYHSFIVDDFSRDIKRVLRWSTVVDECNHTKEELDKFQDRIHPDKALPPSVDSALGALVFFLKTYIYENFRELQLLLFEVGIVYDYTSQKQIISPEYFKKDPLDWVFRSLSQTDPRDRQCLDHTVVYSILFDHLANCTQDEKGRVSGRIDKQISETAALQEILTAVELHRPSYTSRSSEETLAGGDRRSLRMKRLLVSKKETMRIDRTSLDKELPKLVSLLKDFEAVASPNTGRPNQAWIASLEKQNLAMTAHWKGRQELEKVHCSTYGLTEEDTTYCVSFLQASESPEHLEGVAKAKERLLVKVYGPSLASRPTVPCQPEWTPNQEEPVRTTNAREKKKTRREPQLPAQDVQLPLENLTIEEEPAVTKPKIGVKPKTFGILSAMLGDDRKKTKSIEWKDFMNAMGDAGFRGGPTGNGSIFTFRPDECSTPWRGRINFDKPHPVDKVDYILLQAWGRRMSRRFGWNEEMFEAIERK